MPPEMPRSRLTPEERREVILSAAVEVARLGGNDPNLLTRDAVADKCVPPTSADTVKHYFTMPALRAAVRDRLATD